MDLLPHQLEAVYDNLPWLLRVRFVLADDAGGGKTILACLHLTRNTTGSTHSAGGDQLAAQLSGDGGMGYVVAG